MIWRWIIGLLICLGLGHFVTGNFVKYLKGKHGIPSLNTSAWILAFFERLAYILSLINGYPYFIAIWLGVKLVGRWSEGGSLGIPEDVYRNPDGTINDRRKRELASASINIFLTANLVSLLFAVLGAIIIGVRK